MKQITIVEEKANGRVVCFTNDYEPVCSFASRAEFASEFTFLKQQSEPLSQEELDEMVSCRDRLAQLEKKDRAYVAFVRDGLADKLEQYEFIASKLS